MGLADIFYAFGKASAKHDDRTLQFADILRKQDAPGGGPVPPPSPIGEGGPGGAEPAPGPPGGAPLPEEYDFDEPFAGRLFPGNKRKGIPTPKYGNPPNENCVIAGRAHQTLRFELLEQKRLIKITTKDVVDEFHKETGGQNRSLPVLDSLKLWRKAGWTVAGQTCKIKLFTRLDRGDSEKIKRAIHLKIGVGLGFILPDSALDQFRDGEPWDVIREAGERSKPHNGHYVYVSGYTKRGPVCVTWGRKQHMSWAFVNKYCDEAYAIIDNINTPEKKRYLDEKKISKYLENCAECGDG